MTEIAIRSGFGSLRRFNVVFRIVYRRAPTEIRNLTDKAGQALPGIDRRRGAGVEPSG